MIKGFLRICERENLIIKQRFQRNLVISQVLAQVILVDFRADKDCSVEEAALALNSKISTRCDLQINSLYGGSIQKQRRESVRIAIHLKSSQDTN